MGDKDPEPLSRRAAPPPLSARLGWLGIAFAGLYLGSVYIKTPFLRAGITVGDAIDAATPLVLVYLYALVLRGITVSAAETSAGPARDFRMGRHLLLTLGGFALVLGHGIHVAANSIHDAVARSGIADPYGLIEWWDERVSHVAIDGSKVAICAGLTALESRWYAARGSPPGGAEKAPGPGPRAGARLLAFGAASYGFIYFAAGVEGRTTPLLLPFCAAYLVWSLRQRRPFQPVRRFYTLGALVSVLLFAVWGVWHRGFPEFSAVGLIP
ncbi:MAG TPA: hypothetical protein VGJ98_05100 [Candidatus Eisenbacteria bacterium]|jgi:hypothetical protein